MSRIPIDRTGNAGGEKSVCADGKRVRHADCYHCAVRKKMLFADLNLATLDNLLEPINNLLVKPGIAIYHQGEPGAALYSVRKGLVKLVQATPDGDERIVHIAGPGSCIGMEGFLHHHYRQTAETITEVDVCAIPVEAVQKIADQQAVLYRAMLARWQGQFAVAERWMLELSMGTVKQKLARLLLMLDELGHTHGQIRLLSNQDSAGIVASTVETVSRSIAEFKREGALRKIAPSIYQMDYSILQHYAVSIDIG